MAMTPFRSTLLWRPAFVLKGDTVKRRERKAKIREIWQQTFAAIDADDEAARAVCARLMPVRIYVERAIVGYYLCRL